MFAKAGDFAYGNETADCFQTEREPPPRTKFDMVRVTDADYFGFRDEDDDLLQEEAAAEIKSLFLLPIIF